MKPQQMNNFLIIWRLRTHRLGKNSLHISLVLTVGLEFVIQYCDAIAVTVLQRLDNDTAVPEVLCKRRYQDHLMTRSYKRAEDATNRMDHSVYFCC